MAEPTKRNEKTQPLPRTQAQPKSVFANVRLMIFCAAVVALFGVFYLGQASQTTLSGQHTHDLQLELDRVKRENMQLELDIAALTTPARMAERAQRLGLRPVTLAQTQYLIVKDYPPDNPKPVFTANGVIPSPTPTFWNALLARVGLATTSRTAEATTSP